MLDGNFHRTLVPSFLGLSLLVAGGCAKLDWSRLDPAKAIGWSKSQPDPKVPSRVADVWTDTVLNQPGLPGVRGFGGRITFYSDHEKKPVAVDGTLTVYAYDATVRDPVHVSPERRFVFPADQLPKHYSPNKLGPTYSLWLPWDEVGGVERQLSLVARFDARSGETIVSNPSRQTLPGLPAAPAAAAHRTPAPSTPAPATLPDVRQASYDAPVLNPGVPAAMTSFSIDVPPGFAQNMAAARAVVAAQEATIAATSPSAEPKPSASAAASWDAARAHSSSPEPAVEASPSVSYGPRRFPARRAPFVAPTRDPVRRQPRPGAWLSALPPTPRADSSPATQESSSTVGLPPN